VGRHHNTRDDTLLPHHHEAAGQDSPRTELSQDDEGYKPEVWQKHQGEREKSLIFLWQYEENE
jgi:hypothetical protein